MNGAHDLGGLHGAGPVEPEAGEPAFHTEWERRAFAITVAAGFLGLWNIDETRFAREQMPPAAYLASTYYEHWLFGLEKLLVDKGLVAPEEIAARPDGAPPNRAATPAGRPRVLKAADVDKVLRRGGSTRRAEGAPPRFRVGDRVRTVNRHPAGHTRLPRYARDKEGVIDRDHGVFVFADASATGSGEQPQHLYSVRFAARTIWGPDASPRDAVYLDLWDAHLRPA